MKFIAPALAEASRAEGSFSLELNGAKVPLGKPETADISGKLIVHDWEILPGPALQPLSWWRNKSKPSQPSTAAARGQPPKGAGQNEFANGRFPHGRRPHPPARSDHANRQSHRSHPRLGGLGRIDRLGGRNSHSSRLGAAKCRNYRASKTRSFASRSKATWGTGNSTAASCKTSSAKRSKTSSQA